MIERYTREEMGRLWSEKAKYDTWLAVEVAACEAWAQEGKIPADALAEIKQKSPQYDVNRIPEIEAEVKHDVIAFLTAVAEKVGPNSRFIHMGMTSSDLVDTAFAAQLQKSSALISSSLQAFLDVLKEKAFQYKKTPTIGRSHGIHAEPTTFGLKCAIWYAEFKRHQERFALAQKQISVGQISGAVGTFAHISPNIEAHVCKQLHLEAAPVSSQVIQRDRHAFFFTTLANIGASLEKIAVEIRHLQRTDVSEVAEAFGKGQKGSSAMPHKRNPILTENVTGLARLLRGYALSAMENVALWHERDISHSSVERVIGPDACIVLDFMLARMHSVMKNLDVFPENMMKNLELTRGLYASQSVLLALIDHGMTRETAYRVVQSCALEAWNEGKDFRTLLAASSEVKDLLTPKQVDALFDLEKHFRHVDTIFERVFK